MKDPNFIPFIESELTGKIPCELISPYGDELHPLALLAAQKLQHTIELRSITEVSFQLMEDNTIKRLGKMFGVLVVKNKVGEIGFLQAFSGKLGDSSYHGNFVPPVVEWKKDNFFDKGMTEITVLTNEINALKKNTNYLHLKQNLSTIRKEENDKIIELRNNRTSQKQETKELLKTGSTALTIADFKLLELKITNQRIERKAVYKTQLNACLSIIKNAELELKKHSEQINKLALFRKNKSIHLQEELFEQYSFINSKKEKKSLIDLFSEIASKNIPSGAGECAAPKLFQYAFKNNYTPLALAEFWWGKSPQSEKRVHLKCYPPCTEKCKPILGFMLF